MRCLLVSGIPASQQHLVWQSNELVDEKSLKDCHLHSGATLRLVLNMRGGPINTRRGIDQFSVGVVLIKKILID